MPAPPWELSANDTKPDKPYLLTDRPLSYSQISDYLTCKHRWWLRYVLGIRARERARPLEIGDAVHQALASFLAGHPGGYRHGLDNWYRDFERSVPLDSDELTAHARELYANAELIVERAIEGLRELGFWTAEVGLPTVWTAEQLNENKPLPPIARANVVPGVELELFAPLDAWPGGFKAVLDWLAYDPLNDRVWVTDFKTRGYFTTDADEDVNLQNPIYQHIAAANGIETIGTLAFQIANKPPVAPKLNKPKRDGTVEMSRAAVATDWKGYERALRANGLDPTDYGDMKDKLSEKEFVKVTPMMRSREHVERVWSEIVVPASVRMASDYYHWLDLRDTLGTPELALAEFTRNLSPRVCNYCAVKDACTGHLRGWDVRNLVNTLNFKINDQAGFDAAFGYS